MKKFAYSLGLIALMLSAAGCTTASADGTTTTTGPQTIIMYIVVMVVFFGAMYFIAIRPQKKQEKEQKAMLASMQTGDTVLTTSGFYGVVIDITEDTVIVEFGNNKNCRIPMQKAAIVQLEHPEGYVAPTADTAKDAKDSKNMKVKK